MALRTKLDELGKMEGVAHTEKGCPLTCTCGCTYALLSVMFDLSCRS